jgi:hypothetical protein
MSISVALRAAADAEILGFASDVQALDDLLRGLAGASGVCHLHDFWDGLHFVLTAESGDALPLGFIERGDLHYRGAADPTHAVLAATAAALARELAALSEPALRRCFDPPRMLGGPGGRMVYPGRLWTPGGEDRVFGELLGYFNRLRGYVAAAAAEGRGLIVCRYEDW